MILPQSEAYATLQRRLAAIPPTTKSIPKITSNTPNSFKDTFDFPELLKHFHTIQEEHKEQKRRQRLTSLTEKNASNTDM